MAPPLSFGVDCRLRYFVKVGMIPGMTFSILNILFLIVWTSANVENWHLLSSACKRCRKISGVFKCCADTFPLFPSNRCRIHRGRYFDEGMSQKDSRGDSKGPASTQKLNYLYLYFERGDSQHKNIPINTPSKPPYRAFEIFHLKLFI